MVHLVPGEGVLRGSGTVLGLGEGSLGDNALQADGAQVVAFATSRGAYPGSRMGAVALVRQSLLDAAWYAEALAAWRSGDRAERPTLNLAWAALAIGVPTVPAMWVAIFIAGLLFGLGHLPGAVAQGATLDRTVVSTAIVLNMIVAIACGWLFWKHGLLAAILAHALIHIVWYPLDLRFARRP